MRIALLLLLALWPARAMAQTPVVTSAAPEKVAVTIYRNPSGGSGAMELDDLYGFALIAETRTVDLPPGVVTVRFEGVASGIVPQSALIFGAAVGEKNRDAALLSQRGLLDAFTGQRVVLKRTDPATGKTVEERALLRSSASGVVVETARGIEPIYCTGLDETLIFPGVPKTLSAKPTLSMTTKDQPGGKAVITLVYLSGQFDWRANYVGQFNADATELDLFAWLTMASNDDTSFPDAQAAAIAGRVNREEEDDDNRRDDDRFDVDYNCSPAPLPSAIPPPPPPPAPMMMRRLAFESAPAMEDAADNIIVTGARRAELEALGDLKLYRIPMPVTVAARAQKQVAFLMKPRVKGTTLYRVRDRSWDDAEMLFRFKNDAKNGLGEPLPGGSVALFQTIGGQRMLVGEASLADKAVDEEVDLVFGRSSNVTVSDDSDENGKDGEDSRGRDFEDRILTVKNANPVPIRFEAEFSTSDDEDFSRFSGRVELRPGKAVWVATVPANGTAVLRYRQTDKEE